MSSTIHRNPRFAALCNRLRNHPEWLGNWNGTLFRFQTIDFPSPRDILSGEGARWRGGRWNPPGLATLYGSTTDATALEECKASDRYYGVQTKSPRLLVAIEVQLTKLLDLTNPATRRGIDVTLSASGTGLNPQIPRSTAPHPCSWLNAVKLIFSGECCLTSNRASRVEARTEDYIVYSDFLNGCAISD